MHAFRMKLAAFVVLLIQIVVGDVLVYRAITNQLIEEFQDYPALFGPPLPSKGLFVLAVESNPKNACTPIDPPPELPIVEREKYAAVISRSNCSFEEKVRNAQNAGYHAAIVYNINSNDLERMSAKNGSDIRIPSVFVGELTGNLLINGYQYNNNFIVVLNDDIPFNINTHLLIPFAIIVVLCFVTMVIFVIVKCVREQNRLRRHRLPRSLLKKIPIVKITKDHPYETCAICLDDFVEGEKLRVLHCSHAYHCYCIDPWLTKNRRVCPICKRNVFPRGVLRGSRSQSAPSDSLSESETDDTTPLINPVENANNHGTFATTTDQRQRPQNLQRSVSHDAQNRRNENQPTPRVNPFDRVPNLPPTFHDELRSRTEIPRSFWNRIVSIFRSEPSLSTTDDHVNALTQEIESMIQRSQGVPRSQESAAVNLPPRSASNNILNANSSGSFRENSDELINISSSQPNLQHQEQQQQDGQSTENLSRGRIGVAALPNVNFTENIRHNSRNQPETTDRQQNRSRGYFIV